MFPFRFLRPLIIVKYPAVLTFEDILPRLDRFDAIIDVRSPSEFAIDHVPGALNCPVLSDAERAEVGTIYKQVDAFEAKKIGAAYAAKNIGAHIDALFRNKPRGWAPLVYCWRGGNRSGSMAHVLAKIGWPAIQLDGGYKSYRRHVVAALEEMPGRFRFKAVCGATGTGKSRLLKALSAHGAQVLDLEALACHKGSVLGGLITEPQPAQKAFESQIWQTLRRFDPERIVYVESESKKVGNLQVPDALMQSIRSAPCVVLNLSRADRIKLLMEEYDYFIVDPELLADNLKRLVPFYGHEVIDHWKVLADAGRWEELVGLLLDKHYDPAYSTSINRNFSEISSAQVIDIADCSTECFAAAAAQLCG